MQNPKRSPSLVGLPPLMRNTTTHTADHVNNVFLAIFLFHLDPGIQLKDDRASLRLVESSLPFNPLPKSWVFPLLKVPQVMTAFTWRCWNDKIIISVCQGLGMVGKKEEVDYESGPLWWWSCVASWLRGSYMNVCCGKMALNTPIASVSISCFGIVLLLYKM